MFFCPYRRLKKDFDFLEQYKYQYVKKYKHYIHPSIEYKKENITIQIGYNYEEKVMFVYVYNPICYDVLETERNLKNYDYKDQLKIVADIIKKYLCLEKL